MMKNGKVTFTKVDEITEYVKMSCLILLCNKVNNFNIVSISCTCYPH